MSSQWHTSWNAPRILISGSVAYDTILVFEGHFKDHILADKVHMINVAFLAPRLERKYGGTAANIAYSRGRTGRPSRWFSRRLEGTATIRSIG
jgi:hypothetical protein